VSLGGKCYTVHVDDAQKIKKGDLLVTFDMEAIKAEGYALVTPMLITNSDSYKEVAAIGEGTVKVGDNLLKVVA